MNYEDTKPYLSAFLSVDLLTDFAAFCLTYFIDWRSTHSWFVFLTQLCELLPPMDGEELYLCTVECCPSTVPSLWPPPPSPPPFSMYSTVYTDNVWLWGGGVEMYCGPYSAGVLHSVSDKIRNLLNCFTAPTKWPVKTTLRDWCL